MSVNMNNKVPKKGDFYDWFKVIFKSFFSMWCTEILTYLTSTLFIHYISVDKTVLLDITRTGSTLFYHTCSYIKISGDKIFI